MTRPNDDPTGRPTPSATPSAGRAADPAARTPRWVKILGVLLLFIVLIAVLHLTRNSLGEPSSHLGLAALTGPSDPGASSWPAPSPW